MQCIGEQEDPWELQLVGETLKMGHLSCAGEGDVPQGSLELGTPVVHAYLLWSLFEMVPHP